MDIIDYMNETFGTNLSSLEDVTSNENLSLLIQSIRSLVDVVEAGEVTEACYKAGILMVNNIEEPYWQEVPKWKVWINPKNEEWDTYFNQKSEFILGAGKQAAINKLINEWNSRKVVSVEYFLRSFEVMSREYVRAFNPAAVKEIIISLMPLIDKANYRLAQKSS